MNFVKQKAIYMQIADFVINNILSKKLQSGDRIQSVREMAAAVQVNPNTIMRTFNFLQDQGIIFNKRGVGYFIADDALDKTVDLKKDAFVRQYLPEVFKMMDLLKMDIKDLEKIYKENKNGKSNGKTG